MKPLTPALRQQIRSMVRDFVDALPGSPAVDYLMSRGFLPETAVEHRLGYVPAGLPGAEKFEGMLAIPNLCANGAAPVGLKFRHLGEPPPDRPKYDAVAGLPSRLFNLRALNTPSPLIVLTEGELDAVMVEQLGFPAVGVAGANAFKDHHPRVLENYDEVVLIRDPDAAGAALVKKLMATDLPLRVIEPPGGGDVNEAVLAGHGAALIAAIKGES